MDGLQSASVDSRHSFSIARHYVSTLLLDYSVSALFCVGLFVRSLDNNRRQSLCRSSTVFSFSSLVGEKFSLASRRLLSLPTFVVKLPLCVDVSFSLLSYRLSTSAIVLVASFWL